MRPGLLLAGLVALLLSLPATGARAGEWVRAESERFIVYSDVSAQATERFTRRLETYDRVLRLAMGLPPEVAPLRKLPIYLTQKPNGLDLVRPGISRDVAGFYMATTEDVFAVAEYGASDHVLFHEYAHHFMYQNFDASFPGWFVEGFAEYYMTADIRRDGVDVGKFNEDRVLWLNHAPWMSLDDLLAQRPRVGARQHDTYYPLAWLVTHWFMNEPSRRPMLVAYLNGLGRGADGAAAMEQAVGMPLPEFKKTLETYLHARWPFRRVTYDFPEAAVAITPLPAAADDLILLGQRLKIGVRESQIEQTMADVRAAAALHPGDPMAQLIQGHMEIERGDKALGKTLLLQVLEAQPNNVEALHYLAVASMTAADEDPDNASTLIREARGYLTRAYQIDDANYLTFMLLAQSRDASPGYPNDNDMTTWRLAFNLARQLPSIRLGYASALTLRDRGPEAIVVLRPLANAPHGGGEADAAQAMIDHIQSEGGPVRIDVETLPEE